MATFPRGGSDITGTILAVAVKASLYENFTDVDSVFAADPRAVPNARPIPELTFHEMRELAYAGFGVLHEEAIIPAVRAGIPICIKNTNAPEGAGTRLVASRKYRHGEIVGIAAARVSARCLSDINYLGSGMPVFDGKAFDSLMALHQLNLQPIGWMKPRLELKHLDPFGGEPIDPEGFVRIYEKPDRMLTYVMGVDVVEGRENGDYSVITLLCRENKNVVASYFSRLDENLLALVVKMVAEYYTPRGDSYWSPWVGFETPGPGWATFDECDKCRSSESLCLSLPRLNQREHRV